MKKNDSQLKQSIAWFNQLSEEKKSFIIDCVENQCSVRLSNYLLNDDEMKEYSVLSDRVLNELKECKSGKQAIKNLKASGFDSHQAKIFYEYLYDFKQLRIDSEVIVCLDLCQYTNLVIFVMEEMILSKEYRLHLPKAIAYKNNFENTADFIRGARFLHHFILLISDRSAKLSTVLTAFQKDYYISSEFIKIFEEKVEERLGELFQARIINRLNRLTEKIDEIEETLSSLNETEE